MHGSRPPRGLGLAAILLAVAVPLAGCTSSPEPAPTTQPTATSTGAPAFSSESTTAEALAHFDEVNAATVAANARPGGAVRS